MTTDTIKSVISDTRDLAATRKHPATRLALEGIANRLQTLCDAGLYTTPKEVLETVAGARPLDAIFANPPLTFGNRRIFRYREMKSLPRGIQMQEYVHDGGAITYVGQYYNKKDQQPNSRPKRVYRVEVREMPKMFASEEPDWCAAVWEDDTRLVKLVGNSKWNVCYAGLGALRGILHKRCVQTRNNKRWKKAAKAAEKPAENKEV